MQCPECLGYRHDGPCESPKILHAEYLEAFAAYMEYMDRHPLAHRSIKETNEVARLESLCAMAKAKYERAEARRYMI